MRNPSPRSVLPLSFQQAGMVRNMTRRPECAEQYDLVSLFRVDGPLDGDALAAAVDDLTRRHAMLRTVVTAHDGGHGQYVANSPCRRLAVREWEHRGASDVVEALAAERRGADEVLDGAALFRAALHTTADGTLLSFALHHLIYDGWSLSVLWRDLSEFYAARTLERPAGLSPLTYDYPDFVRDQRRDWPELAERSMGFWRDVTAGAPSAVPWAPPAEGGCADTWRAARHTFTMNSGSQAAVRRVARRNRLSPSMALLGATAWAVARTTGQRDLLLGTDTAGRDRGRGWDVVGHCVNARITRLTAPHAESPLHLARRAGEAWRSSEPHRHVYEDHVLDACGEAEPLKVNFAGAAGDEFNSPRLGPAVLTALDVPVPARDRRAVQVRWQFTEEELRGRITFRPAEVAEGVVDELATALASAVGELCTGAGEGRG
ncbi:condensation domain-containing protein [Streptomyces sp. NPDC006617]|uniref:condensation domain-containing protein n=1 Tax=Streptomyces sp. NPDC006617 TaxID=3155354 RepID=UPI0033A7883C